MLPYSYYVLFLCVNRGTGINFM